MPNSPDGSGSPGADYLRANLGSFTGNGTKTNGAKVTAVYDTRFPSTPAQSHFKFAEFAGPYALPDGTYLTYEAEFGGEVMLTEDGTWKYTGTTTKLTQQAGITIPAVLHTVTWSPVIAPPFGLIKKNVGRVNATEFMGVGAERLLFLGGQHTPLHRFQLGGDSRQRPYYKIVYRFAETCKQSTATDGTLFGHNHFYKKDKVGSEHFIKVEAWDDSAVNPYRTGDFKTLFRYPTTAAEAA